MNIEHRLQHAARELREVPIVVPPLGSRTRAHTPRRVHALATPMLVPLLFVAGALFAIGATRPGVHQSIQTDIPAASRPASPGDAEPPADTRSTDESPAVHAPSVLVELQMIADLVNTRSAPAPAETPDPVAEEPGRPANIIGPI